MDDVLRSEIVGTAGPTLAAATAIVLTLMRKPAIADRAEWRRVATLFVLTVGAQVAHFGEEYATHFEVRFPRLLGLTPWPPAFFVLFNVAWLAIWATAVFPLSGGSRVALFAAWFLALAALLNGVAHPLLAIEAGGYFPGLLTSPMLGVAGALLLRRLVAATAGNS